MAPQSRRMTAMIVRGAGLPGYGVTALASLRLTYCGNVHPAADLDGWLGALHQYAVPVAAHMRQRGREFGLGSWWNAGIARQLASDPAAFARVQEELLRQQLPIWTMNVFPHGVFHGGPVKTAVYTPDWEHEDRVQYTRDCAEVVARLCAREAVVPLSTLPLGYRGAGAGADLRKMARNLARTASAFAAIESRTGVTCVLALEPEPCCLLETCAQAAAFLEDWLFEEGAWTTVPEAALRRHLGVCVDLCHLAVVGEEPLAAIADLRARGIAVPKIQVSSCLELRDGGRLDDLLRYDEPVYLHQTVAANGLRALDLAEVRRRRAEFAAAGTVRTHFHMPLFVDDLGPGLGTSRREVERVLTALREGGHALPVLEVETYTWSLFGSGAFDAPELSGRQQGITAADLAAELDFAANRLGV